MPATNTTASSLDAVDNNGTIEIPPRSGTAFKVHKGQRLTVIDPQGSQVSDLLAFNADDVNEVISSGRTLDYASHLLLSTPDPLYSNRSNVLLRITADTCGRNDFTLTPCSRDTFRILYHDADPHHGCFGNLAAALAPYGVAPDMIPIAFNCFMNVDVDRHSEKLDFKVLPPTSKPGDRIEFVAERDLIVALTACSAGLSNGGSFKPIWYRISDD